MEGYSIDLKLHFDCRPIGKEWEARCRSVPGVGTFGATQDAALGASAAIALLTIAELIEKGDRTWAQFKEHA